ncbi:MAG: hypothetical protein B7Z80_06515 [Rhodospirillales bacterium 20-64-7]|nr:MAG: hypothetical protein B7Z80_06515 [Rhodospirillales bacterium 20-64-7]HQT76698.1 DUF3576 domain-containing protein [Rhodopila sp.]
MRLNQFSACLCSAACLAVLALAGCSSDAVKPNPTPPNYGGMGSGGPGDPSMTSRLGGDDSGELFSFGKKRNDGGGTAGSGSGIGVNAFLWRGALDTISFMPLASADPFGGVIITDWYSPPGSTGERFKATIYILSRDLRSDGVRVNIFRQVLQNGQWIDAPVADSTVGDIENKVLARARQMREQLQASG